MSPQQFYRSWSGNGSYPLVNGACYGKWPANGQGGYSNGCYGHDEPAINPYSDLAGSGGNVTWTVTLPIDRSPTQNQSDLYTAIWFGMNLYDPYGYSGQCFFELQLYPDTNGNFLPQPGVWSGFAVAWQIELATGVEDPCYAAPLNVGSSTAPFVMNQGDTLTVTMLGWVGSPYGELVSVVDNTNGLSGGFDLYNTTGHYPLDPAYVANNLDDALPWSPGGDLPVAFSFESGHTYGGPSNNSFGGCSSGVPPPTPLNPSTPCDAYDPQSWANDTTQPWLIHSVQFFHGAIRQTATQIGFEQDFGGIAWIDPLSLGTCQGRDGSAYCSYPWYSYSRSANSIEFGATDYYGLTYDFGQYRQYDSTLTTNSAALGYFPVRNFTVPALVGDSLTISIPVGGGTVHFLNYTLTTTTTIPHLPSGSYSINSVPVAGEHFLGYSTTGTVVMDAAGTPWNSFRIDGAATITANFGLVVPPTVAVHYASPGGLGGVAISSGFNLPTTATYPGQIVAQYAPVGSMVLSNGGTDNVVPGMYSIQAYPNPGYNFTGWSVTGGVYIFAPQTNYTWINVSSTGGGTLTATFAPTTMTDTVWLESVPATGGQIIFNGVTYPSGTILNRPVGAYTIAASPNASYSFATWSYLWSASMSYFAVKTDVVLQNGTSWIYALFNSTPSVTLGVIGAGSIAFNGVVRSGVVPLAQVEATSYPIVALPSAGSAFASWTVTNPTNLSVSDPFNPVTTVTVSGSGTLTATFVAGGAFAVTFNTVGSGSIRWNFNQVYSGSVTNSSIGGGNFSIAASAGSGAMFVGWSSTGAATLYTLYSLNALGEWVTQYDLTVRGPSSVTATFAAQTFPVTFVDEPTSTGTLATFTGTGPAVAIPGGMTANLAPGVYSVTVSGGSIPVASWAATSNLTLSATSGLTVSVAVAGSGSLYVQAVALPVVVSVTATPTIVEPGVPFTVTASVAGGTTPLTFTLGGLSSLPPGTLTCLPSPYVSLGHVDSGECTAAAVGTFTVYANVTDLFSYSASGATTIQVVSGPAIGFTAPVAHSQHTGTVYPFLPLTVSWTNTIVAGALSGLEETVALVNDATGQTISNTPSATNVGRATLLVPAGATNSVTITSADLIGPYVNGLPPTQYTVRVTAYSTAVLGAGGFPTIQVSTNLVPFTVASIQVFAPLDGAVFSAGNVTYNWQLTVPGNYSGTDSLRNATGYVTPNGTSSGTGFGQGPGIAIQGEWTLAPGHYTFSITTYNKDAAVWYNVTVKFTVVPAATLPAPPPVYHNTTSLPAYVNELYAGLFVVGLAVGLLVMWAFTRGRRRPPTVTMTPRPPTPAPAVVPPPAVAAPSNVPEWAEDPPSPPRY